MKWQKGNYQNSKRARERMYIFIGLRGGSATRNGPTRS